MSENCQACLDRRAMESLRYTRIEQTAMLQNDSPHDDFASHFYLTRYDGLKELPMLSPEHLRVAVRKENFVATGKIQYELLLLRVVSHGKH